MHTQEETGGLSAMQKSLKAFLSSLGAEVEKNVKLLNYGGCCVYASIVGEELKKLGVPVKGVAANWKVGDITAARKNGAKTLEDFERNNVQFNHIVLRVNKTYVDSTGVHRKWESVAGEDKRAKGHLTVSEMETLANSFGWNPAFDRKQIPTIRKIVKKRFAEYKKSLDNRTSTN